MDHNENNSQRPSKGFNGFQFKEIKRDDKWWAKAKTRQNWKKKVKEDRTPRYIMNYDTGFDVDEKDKVPEMTLMEKIKAQEYRPSPIPLPRLIVVEKNLFDLIPEDPDLEDGYDEGVDIYLRKKPICVAWNKLSSCFERQSWDVNNSFTQKSTHSSHLTQYSTNQWGGNRKGYFIPPRGSGVLFTSFSSWPEFDSKPSYNLRTVGNTSHHDYRQNIASSGRRSVSNYSQGLNKSNMTMRSDDDDDVHLRVGTVDKKENTIANISRVSNTRNKSNTTAHSIDRFNTTTNEKKANVTTQSQGANKSNMTVYSFDISDVSGDNNPMNISTRSCGRNRSNVTVYSHDDSPSVTQSRGCYRTSQNGNHVVDIFGEISRKDGGARLANQLKNIQILNATREDLGKLDRSACG